MPSCGVRRPSVNICANRFFSQANGWIATKLAHDGSQLGLHPGCAQGEGRGQSSHDMGTSVISQKNKIASSPRKWLDREQTHSFDNLPLPFSIPFSSAPQSQMAVSLCCEFSHSSHREAVCQTVCYPVWSHVLSLHAHTLWSTITLSFRLSIKQLNIMCKCWNELLRHWQSGLFV